MAACTRCWRKARPIFKQHILALYPSHADSLSIAAQYPLPTNVASPDYSLFHDPLAQPRNLSDLTFYAQMFPNKLTRIGRYMCKKMKQAIRDNQPRSVHLSMLAMIGLVDACHSDDLLILYDESVCEELRLLLVHPLFEHRILAAQGLCKLMGFIDDSADFRKYEPFFAPLISMCTSNETPANGQRKQEEMVNRVRLSGLQGLSAMVIHFYSQRLVDHYDEIIPAALANIHIAHVPGTVVVIDGGSTVTVAAISACAYEMLTLLAAKVSIPDLDTALTPLFSVLDGWEWRPENRCASVVIVLTNGLQSDSDLVLFELLKHALVLEQKTQIRGDPIVLKIRMAQVAALLISAMRINVLHWEGIVDLFIHHAVAASRSASPVAHDYSRAITSCWTAYAQKLPSSQDLISLLFHLTQFSYTSASPPLKASLLSCANLIVLQAPDLSSGADASFTSTATVDSLVRSLLTCAVLTQEVMVRERVYEVLLNLLLPPIEAEDDAAVAPSVDDSKAKIHRLLSQLAEGKHIDERDKVVKLTDKEQRWILTILYHELSCSIAPTTGALSSASMTVVDPASSSTSPQPVVVDSIVITVDDDKSLTSNIKAPGRGATSPHAFELAYQLLVALLYQSPAASLVLQWPLMNALHQLANSPHVLSAANKVRCALLVEAWLFAVSRIFALGQSREVRQATAELDAFITQLPHAWPADAPINIVDVAFDANQPSRGLFALATPSASRPYLTSLDTSQVIRLLSRVLEATGTSLESDEGEAAAHDHSPSAVAPSKELQVVFEPFNVKFLPPSKLLSDERETSWAPSHRPDRERRYSFDARESLTRVDSPFHSGYASPKVVDRNVGSKDAVDGEEAKLVDDQSYAAVATAYNTQTTRNEAVFRQSMRILVDQTIGDDSIPSTSQQPHTPASTSSASRPLYSRRRSLSTRRQSGLQTGPLSTFSASLASASASATADKFFAAPAVAAPPTLDVNAAIRQQIESSYALSPSHAVSGSVNVNGVSLEDEGAATPVKHNVRRSSHSAPAGPGGATTGSGSLTGSGKEGHADWNRESWMLAEQRIDVGSVDEGDDEDDAQLTDEIVYGITEDMEGLSHHHLAGTGENILKFQFPVLNTFDSYVPELD